MRFKSNATWYVLQATFTVFKTFEIDTHTFDLFCELTENCASIFCKRNFAFNWKSLNSSEIRRNENCKPNKNSIIRRFIFNFILFFSHVKTKREQKTAASQKIYCRHMNMEYVLYQQFHTVFCYALNTQNEMNERRIEKKSFRAFIHKHIFLFIFFYKFIYTLYTFNNSSTI